jgi:hypothetical protein
MAIYEPVPKLDARRARLLYLLGKLIDESLRVGGDTNRQHDVVALSIAERKELLALLAELIEDRSIIVSLSFVDGLAGVGNLTESQLREIYLSERKRRGRTRALASKQWADFWARLGRQSGWSRWGVATEKMSYEHFLEMERRLFRALRFPEKVRAYLIERVTAVRDTVEGILELRDIVTASESLSRRTMDLLKQLKSALQSADGSSLSTSQVAGLAIVVSNLSVLFTTRDWSAAGTMSAISGGGVQLIGK